MARVVRKKGQILKKTWPEFEENMARVYRKHGQSL
jgi:hypothetical protein